MTMNKTTSMLLICAALALAACGGGGGGGPASTGPVASANAFNLQSAYANYVRLGSVKTFSISGSCTGSTTLNTAPAATTTTFEGRFAYSAATVSTTTLTNCTPASSSNTLVRYYDSNYMPVGRTGSTQYAIYATAPTIPTSARVGDAGVVGTLTVYTNSSKTVLSEREETSYVVEPDTATTAIVNIITRSYNASNVLTSTEQDRYRIAADGTLSAVSFDIQYANGSTTRLIGN